MHNRLQFSPFGLALHGRQVTFHRPVVMGILNVTPDSFYDGGRHSTPQSILAHAKLLLDSGADVLDLGAVSTRPGAQLLPPEVEAERLASTLRLLRQSLPPCTIISVDTCYSLPAARAVEAGADIINDISGGLFDPQMFPTVASLGVPYILTHNRARPDVMLQPQHTHYRDIIDDLSDYYQRQLDTLQRLGIDQVWLDPGFGFAKTTDTNHELLLRLSELVDRFPRLPLLAALSNKSMITRRLTSIDALANPSHLTPSEVGTVVLNTLALQAGARVLRVHSPLPSQIAIQLLFDPTAQNPTQE